MRVWQIDDWKWSNGSFSFLSLFHQTFWKVQSIRQRNGDILLFFDDDSNWSIHMFQLVLAKESKRENGER